VRFKLTLEIAGNCRLLPINYQYEQSAWIYHTIHYGNPEFATWLHEQGYLDGKKQFKLFTFSPIHPQQYKIKGDRIELCTPEAFTYISFYTPEAAEPFIMGLFRNQQFTLGDTRSQVTFRITSVEKMPEPAWGRVARFRTLSPVVISRQNADDAQAQYLSPEDEGYDQLFIKHLLSKWRVVPGQTLPISNIAFKLCSTPRSKLLKIKAGTTQQTQVRGFLFDFEMEAPAELLSLGYSASFGEKGSVGFGCCKVVEK
jgi:CRISPR-associated endoribonuclease Cas6